MSRKKRKNNIKELQKAINSQAEKSGLIQSIKNVERIDYNQKFKQSIDLDPSIRGEKNAN